MTKSHFRTSSVTVALAACSQAGDVARLLGGTRAALLRLALTERTTTELAGELGVSAATVSGHTKTLRAAGLIITVRAGKAVLHSVTPLGDRLLESAGRTASRGRG